MPPRPASRPASPKRDASPRSDKQSPSASPSPKPKKKVTPKKRPPKSGGSPGVTAVSPEELFERFGAEVSREQRAGGSDTSLSSLQEQLAESQRTQFEQHVALESMRKLLEAAQIENTRLTSRCARLAAKLGEAADEVDDKSTERYPTGDDDDDDTEQLMNRGMGLAEIAKMLRPAPETVTLDATKVYSSLPTVLQGAFDERSVDALDEALRALPPYEAHYHMQRCVDCSLWDV